MISDCGSLTGSLCQGVSRLDWLFRLQVKPSPDSVTMAPKLGLAITFAQGAGVFWPAFNVMTYSSAVNPPKPLKNEACTESRGKSGSWGGALQGANSAGGVFSAVTANCCRWSRGWRGGQCSTKRG